MPEPPIPSPTRDRPVSRNLFVEADPDLDTLAQSTADEPARSAGRASARSRPRSPRRAVPIAPQCASARCRALHPSERQRRALAGRSVPRHRHADAAAGRLLRDLATRPYRALLTIVALTLLLFAFSWLVLDVRDISTARRAANGRLARNAITLRHQQARIGALTTELRQVAQTARQSQTSAAPARPLDRQSPADDAQAADRPPLPPSSLIAMSPQPEPQQSPAAMPRPRGRVDRSPPRGKHPRQHTNRRAAARAAARPAGTRRATRPRSLGARSGRRRSLSARPDAGGARCWRRRAAGPARAGGLRVGRPGQRDDTAHDPVVARP